VGSQYPADIDVGSEASNAAGTAVFQEEVTVYKDVATAQKVFAAGTQSVSCTHGTVGSSSRDVTFSSPKDRSSQLKVPTAVEIDFDAGTVTGQLFAIQIRDTVVTMQFSASSSIDASQLPDALTIVKRGLQKLAL
jgi:hypothetical protein